jgi:hypothetical protein
LHLDASVTAADNQPSVIHYSERGGIAFREEVYMAEDIQHSQPHLVTPNGVIQQRTNTHVEGLDGDTVAGVSTIPCFTAGVSGDELNASDNR